jgi:hypothetical protein
MFIYSNLVDLIVYFNTEALSALNLMGVKRKIIFFKVYLDGKISGWVGGLSQIKG